MTKEDVIRNVLQNSGLSVPLFQKTKMGFLRLMKEAMDEWGRQCWNEAKKKRPQLDTNGFCINYTYDDYVKEMEGNK